MRNTLIKCQFSLLNSIVSGDQFLLDCLELVRALIIFKVESISLSVRVWSSWLRMSCYSSSRLAFLADIFLMSFICLLRAIMFSWQIYLDLVTVTCSQLVDSG